MRPPIVVGLLLLAVWAGPVPQIPGAESPGGKPELPGINTVYPPAVERGQETRIRLIGEFLDQQPRLMVPFSAEVHRDEGSANLVWFRIRPAADTPPGIYPIRVRTRRGLSNLRLIQVTDIPVVTVPERTDEYAGGRLQIDRAMPIRWPVVLAGGRLSNDADLFRFPVEAGQRLLIETQTRRLGLTPDPLLWLRNSQGRKLASAHDTPGLRADERIDHRFAQVGDHLCELQSFGVAGWNNHYLLRIDDRDWLRTIFPLGGPRGEEVRFTTVNRDGVTSTVTARVPDDPWSDHWQLPMSRLPASLPPLLAAGDLPEIIESGDNAGEAGALIEWPVTINGRVLEPDSGDRFRIRVTPGQQIRATVEAFPLGSRLDGYLLAYDAGAQKLIAANDDQKYRGNPDPWLNFEVPEGTTEVTIELRDTLGRGGPEFPYRLTIEEGGADFSLTLGKRQTPSTGEGDGWARMDRSDTLTLHAGQPTKLKISVERKLPGTPEFSGPIRLRAIGLPEGIIIPSVTVGAGDSEAEMICTADDSAPAEPFEFVIVGEGRRGDEKMIRRVARRRLYLADAQMPHLAQNWQTQKVLGLVIREQSAP